MTERIRTLGAANLILCFMLSACTKDISDKTITLSTSDISLMPFPQHVQYYPGVIKPNQFSQSQLDNSVHSFYELWKERYIKCSCDKRQFYVWFDEQNDKKQSYLGLYFVV